MKTETETENRKTETEKPITIWFGLVFGFRFVLPTPIYYMLKYPGQIGQSNFLENFGMFGQREYERGKKMGREKMKMKENWGENAITNQSCLYR